MSLKLNANYIDEWCRSYMPSKLIKKYNKFLPSAPQLVKARGNGSDFIKSLELIQTK